MGVYTVGAYLARRYSAGIGGPSKELYPYQAHLFGGAGMSALRRKNLASEGLRHAFGMSTSN